MDNHLMIFESADFGRVRSVLKDGAPWFVAVDVCKALGLNQVTRAMSRLDSDEGGLLEVPHPQNADKTIEINAVSEAGLYHLILCSKKPEARAFKRWITHAVIPSIRKHGAYMTDALPCILYPTWNRKRCVNLILFVPDNSYCLVCNTREGQGFAITWRSPVAAYSF